MARWQWRPLRYLRTRQPRRDGIEIGHAIGTHGLSPHRSTDIRSTSQNQPTTASRRSYACQPKHDRPELSLYLETRGPSLTAGRELTPPSILSELPFVAGDWTVWLPEEYSATGTGLSDAAPKFNWRERIFGVLGRPAGSRPFNPFRLADGAALVNGLADGSVTGSSTDSSDNQPQTRQPERKHSAHCQSHRIGGYANSRLAKLPRVVHRERPRADHCPPSARDHRLGSRSAIGKFLMRPLDPTRSCGIFRRCPRRRRGVRSASSSRVRKPGIRRGAWSSAFAHCSIGLAIRSPRTNPSASRDQTPRSRLQRSSSSPFVSQDLVMLQSLQPATAVLATRRQTRSTES